jgi:predicted RNA-binding Zn-ribbon protein involved in translation (DUF1610 family)
LVAGPRRTVIRRRGARVDSLSINVVTSYFTGSNAVINTLRRQRTYAYKLLISYQFVTESDIYSKSDPDSNSSFGLAMASEMTTEQLAPQQAPTFDSAVNTFVELRAASLLTNEQFATVISALKNDNGVATMDMTYTDAHRSCVSKKPTPLDLSVTQTTAASMKPAGKEWEDLRAEWTAEKLRFVRAELNALRVEFREEMDREERKDSFKCYNCGGAGHMERNCMSSKKKDSFKCYNCGRAGHMARYCASPKKKKEARKSAGVTGLAGT